MNAVDNPGQIRWQVSSRKTLSLAFYGVLFLPTLVVVSLSASSTASGLALHSCLFLAWLTIVAQVCKAKMSVWLMRRTVYFVGAILMVLAIHGIVALVTNEHFHAPRFFGSLLLIGTILLGSAIFAVHLARLDEATMSRWITRGLWVLAANAILGLLGFSPFPAATTKPVGIFTEPSLFALIVAPLLSYACVARTRRAPFFVMFFLIWGVAIQNLTILFVVVVAVSLVARFRFLHALIAVTVAACMLLFADTQYFVDRLLLSSDSDNLSVLVWLQGWEHALIMLNESAGWGAGFQQFGFQGVSGEVNDKLERLGHGHLNVLDGGSVAAKLVGEFGYFGAAMVSVYVLIVLIAWRRIRASASSRLAGGPLFLAVCVYSMSTEVFARGVGYFTPSVFLALGGLFWLICLRRRRDVWRAS